MNLAYTDLNGLHSIKTLARSDRAAALEQVARQFESFFVAEILKGVRAANEVFGADNPMNTNEMAFRQQMLDQQLSVSLTEGRGLGLAQVFARQLCKQYGTPARGDNAEPDSIDEAQLAAREIERARASPPSSQSASVRAGHANELPTVVRNALDLLRPVVEEARKAVDSVARFVDKASFVQTLAPLAREAGAKLGVDHRVLLAQAALETGWGQSILGDSAGRSSFNLFNIKAGSFWDGDSVGVNTLEFDNGVPRAQRARFRAYASFAESFADYAHTLLSSERYRGALGAAADPARFVHGLANAGYATDPAYAAKILRLLRDPAIAGAP